MPKEPKKQAVEISLYFENRYHDLAERFLKNRNLYLLVQCAWCHRKIGWQRKEKPSVWNVSHGICRSCYPKVFGEQE